jgi:hypothetical protein
MKLTRDVTVIVSKNEVPPPQGKEKGPRVVLDKVRTFTDNILSVNRINEETMIFKDSSKPSVKFIEKFKEWLNRAKKLVSGKVGIEGGMGIQYPWMVGMKGTFYITNHDVSSTPGVTNEGEYLFIPLPMLQQWHPVRVGVLCWPDNGMEERPKCGSGCEV